MNTIPFGIRKAVRIAVGRVAFFSAAFLLAGAFGAFAAEYFVDFSAGSDANAGTTQGAPWKHAPGDSAATGAPAAAALQPGDIVTFRGGVQYNGSLTLSRSGTAAQRILYRGGSWGASLAIIDGQSSRAGGFTVNANYLRIEGFEIRNTTTFGIWHDSQGSGTGIQLVNNSIHQIGPWPAAAPEPSGCAVYMRYTQDLLVQDSEHYNTAGDALRVFDSTNAIIRNNNFHDGQVDGIMGGSNGTLTIDRNTIHGFTNITTHGDAMQIMQGDVVIVSNNLIYDNTQNIYFDTYLSGMTTGYIYNNIVVNTVPGTDGNQGWYNGIVIDHRFHSIGALYVYENTLVNLNTGSGGFRNLGAAGFVIGTVTLRNNVFLNSGNNADVSGIVSYSSDHNDYYNVYRSTVLPGLRTLAQYIAANLTQEQNSIGLDPMLDAANLYAPQAGSPAVDGGTALAAHGGTSFSTDFNAAARPLGSGWDMGAFESSGAVATAPAAPTGLHVVP